MLKVEQDMLKATRVINLLSSKPVQILAKLDQKCSAKGCWDGADKGLNRMKGNKNQMEPAVWLANLSTNGIRAVRRWETCLTLFVLFIQPPTSLK
jgi:hypothetical protein